MPASRNPGAVSGSVTTMNLYTDERLPEFPFSGHLCDLTAGNNSDIRNLGKFCPDIGNRYGNGERISHELTYCLFYKISFQFFFKGRYLLCGNVFRRDLCDELVGGMLGARFSTPSIVPAFIIERSFSVSKSGLPCTKYLFTSSETSIPSRTERSTVFMLLISISVTRIFLRILASSDSAVFLLLPARPDSKRCRVRIPASACPLSQ